MALPKTLMRLRDDWRVTIIDDERDTGDGYWLYLAPGYFDPESGLTMIHEWTVRDVVRKFAGVRAMTDFERNDMGEY